MKAWTGQQQPPNDRCVTVRGWLLLTGLSFPRWRWRALLFCFAVDIGGRVVLSLAGWLRWSDGGPGFGERKVKEMQGSLAQLQLSIQTNQAPDAGDARSGCERHA